MGTYITPSVIAASALATLYNTTVLLPLVNRDYEGDFQGKQGDTITVRTPATFTVDEFETEIELQTPEEGSFNVKLDKLLDVSFPVTSKEMTLQIDRFEERLLNPAMEAISQGVDARLGEALVDAAGKADGGGTVKGEGTSAGDRHKAFRAAKRVLSRNKLPLTQRYAVLSPEAVEAITGDSIVLQANTSGSTEALREGGVGRLSAFDTFESQVLSDEAVGGNLQTAEGIAFHRSAVAAVTRTLEKPEGVAPSQVAVRNYKGLGLRVVKDYDINKKRDIISIDLLFGAAEIRKQGAVELEFGVNAS